MLGVLAILPPTRREIQRPPLDGWHALVFAHGAKLGVAGVDKIADVLGTEFLQHGRQLVAEVRGSGIEVSMSAAVGLGHHAVDEAGAQEVGGR